MSWSIVHVYHLVLDFCVISRNVIAFWLVTACVPDADLTFTTELFMQLHLTLKL